MNVLNRKNFEKPKYTTRVVQFGEGNFLRAFVDWQLDLLNEKTDLDAGVAIIRPIDSDFPPLLNEQDGLYTSVIRGINESNEAVEEMRVISSVNEEVAVYKDVDKYFELARNPDIQFVFSNTTEAGIAFDDSDSIDEKPAGTFPAKLTQWLLERFKAFDGDMSKGLFIVPCELIDYNGEKLKEMLNKYVELWQLGEDFSKWLNEANTFCSTLVDRIVTGHPREELPELEAKVGYKDQFMATGEYFYLFVIQGPQSLADALKLKGQDLNIKIVDDIKPYKERKVAILNGAHTALVPLAYMSDIDTVGEAMDDPLFSKFVSDVLGKEVIPALSLPESELKAFADSVIQRFKNPYIKHQLISISLNSMTKWKTRLLPQLLKNAELNGEAPELMSMALAGQILLYKGVRNGEKTPLSDDELWLSLFSDIWSAYDSGSLPLSELVGHVLGQKDHWELDLNDVPKLHQKVLGFLENMLAKTTRVVVSDTLGE